MIVMAKLGSRWFCPSLQWGKCAEQDGEKRHDETDGDRDGRRLRRIVEHRRERTEQRCADDDGHEQPEPWIWQVFALLLGSPRGTKKRIWNSSAPAIASSMAMIDW